jgi:hypothetical protein
MDLFNATREGKAPRLPFISYTDSYILNNGQLAIETFQNRQTRELQRRLGASFARMWSMEDGQPIADLLTVIRYMCDFTIVVDNYNQGVYMKSLVMIDQRNFTQHGLWSLRSARKFECATGNICDQLYEPCRLACMVYSLLVIFPYPPTVTVCSRLATSIKRSILRITTIQAIASERTSMELKLWTLVMGCLISTGLPHRGWFVAQIKALAKQLNVDHHSSLTDILQGYLWHPRTSARDGMELWRELQSI